MQFSLTPDILFTTRQSRQIANLRAQLEQVGQEAITGRRADVVEATHGRVGDAFLLEKAALDVQRQQGATNLAIARVDGAANTISTIRETLTGFAPDGRTTLANGQPSDFLLLAENAADSLGMITGALGRRHGTRHLFSGTNTIGGPLAPSSDIQTAIDTLITGAATPAAAITAIDDYFNQTGGGFETNIYRGSVEDGPRLHVTNSQSFDPIPKADNVLFRDIMRGFSMIAGANNAASDAERNTIMEAGLDVLDQALEGVLAMESRLGATQHALSRVNDALVSEASLIANTQNNLLGRDVFDAAAELQALEGQLEASYTVTGRLGSLSLTNFLR